MKNKVVRIGITMIAILSLILSMTACKSSDTEETKKEVNEVSNTEDTKKATTTLEKSKERGYITVGFANEIPYTYQAENGELTGEAVDIARAVLKNLGINDIRGELVEFSALIPGLQADRFDMITAGMAVTAERAKEVLFAKPEISYGEALLVAEGNPKGLKSYADIAADSSIKVAIPGGVVEYDFLTGSGVAESQIQIVNDLASAISALKSERVDCVNASNTSLTTALETTGSDGLELVGDFEQVVIGGVSTVMYGASAFYSSNHLWNR